jgi:hypothetical protein
MTLKRSGTGERRWKWERRSWSVLPPSRSGYSCQQRQASVRLIVAVVVTPVMA